MRCVLVWRSYGDETWEQYLERSKSTRQRRAEDDRCVQHIDQHGIGDVSLPGPASSVQSRICSGYWIQAGYDIFNEEEFRKHHEGVDMYSVGLKPNQTIVSEQGVQEEVLVLRDETPRKLIAITQVDHMLGVDKMTQYVRPGQPEDQFAQVVQDELQGCSYKRGAGKISSTAAVKEIVTKHLAALKAKEDESSVEEGEGLQEESEEEVVGHQSKFFGLGKNVHLGRKKGVMTKGKTPAKAKFAPKRKGFRLSLASPGKGGIAASTGRATVGHGSDGARSLAADLASSGISVSGFTAQPLRSGSVASVVVSDVEDAARSAAPAVTGTTEQGKFNFNFDGVISGTVDKTALNGVSCEMTMLPTSFKRTPGSFKRTPGTF